MATLALLISLAWLVGTTLANIALIARPATREPIMAPRATRLRERIWSSVLFMHNGERVPSLPQSPAQGLTALGAQQMYSQGALFRTRYLKPNTSTHLSGLDETFNASMVRVLARGEDGIVAGATAFVQGMYPPTAEVYPSSGGGLQGATRADGIVLEYPLHGYQYARVTTASVDDPSAIWVNPNANCPTYRQAVLASQNSVPMRRVANASKEMYEDLANRFFTNQTWAKDMVLFVHARELYEFASYMYTHDSATRKTLSPLEIAGLGSLAAVREKALNGDLKNSVSSIAGRTLAGAVARHMDGFIDAHRRAALGLGLGLSSFAPLHVLFGTYESFVSFFALVGLDFAGLPPAGAVMAWELFSVTEGEDFPKRDEDLFVRFLYRAGTDPASELTAYPLFQHNATATPARLFTTKLHALAVRDYVSWCAACQGTATFCHRGDRTTTRQRPNEPDRMRPQLAGLIGAAVAVPMTVLLVWGMVTIGKMKIVRMGVKARSGDGGFKGGEKLEGDRDVRYGRDGGRQQRLGSWEMGGGVVGGDGHVQKGQWKGGEEEGFAGARVARVARKGGNGGDGDVERQSVQSRVDSLDGDLAWQPTQPREF